MTGSDRMVADLSQLYHRELPGGGYVAIEMIVDGAAGDGAAELERIAVERRGDENRRFGHQPPSFAIPAGRPFRARVCVERRAEVSRRDGHEPPVIAEAQGDTSGTVFGELYRIASDNAAVARGLLRWKAAREQRSM
ncbi:MAG: hypothetical protein ABR499_16890 [Gemmatimonadaceae bacterium]